MLAKKRSWVGKTLANRTRQIDLLIEHIGGDTPASDNRIERGRVVPSLRTLEVLAGLFAVPVRDMFEVGNYAAQSGKDDGLVRLIDRLSGLDSDDLNWIDDLVRVALMRKVRAKAG